MVIEFSSSTPELLRKPGDRIRVDGVEYVMQAREHRHDQIRATLMPLEQWENEMQTAPTWAAVSVGALTIKPEPNEGMGAWLRRVRDLMLGKAA